MSEAGSSGDGSRAPQPALFLDRDGVINVDKGFVRAVSDFQWIEGAASTIAAFNARGWLVFVVTNQSGIAHGYYTETDMHQVHAWMCAELAKSNAHIDRIYFCPFDENGTVPEFTRESFDRKPRPGMIIQAMTDFAVDKDRSFLIGDKETDIAAARAAGIPGFLFTGGDLARFAEWALADVETNR